MALDPRVIAALSAGAKTSSTYQPGEYATEQTGGAWNLGQGIIDVLSTGGYATAGLTSKIGQNLAAIGRGEVGAVADLVNPLSGLDSMVKGVSERRTYSQNLQDMGVDRNTSVWLGLALDIGLDPTTYITGGVLAGAKGAAQGAKIASQASKAGKIADVAKTDFVPVGRELSRDEKLGNLLAGISKGYEAGKTQYKLSIKNNKLTKIQNKKRKAIEKLPLGEVGISSAFAKTTNQAAPASAVERITAKEARATEQLAKAKKAADAAALPGVTAGLSKATAAKLAADTQRIVSTVEKTSEGAYQVVVRDADGIVQDHSFAKKTYKTEANAKKAADRAAKEVEGTLRGGGEFDVQASTVAAEPTDDAARLALRSEEASARDTRIRAELAEGSKKNYELNLLAKSFARPGAYRQVRELGAEDAARLEDLKEQFLARIDDFADAEEAALKVGPNRIEKTTIDDLVKYVNAPAKTAQRDELYEQLLAAPVRLPSSFTALARALDANGVDVADVNIGDLIYLVNDADELVATQAREAFALAKNIFEEASASAGQTLKPWIDGVVTPRDAEDAIKAMVELVYADLPKRSREYKAIVAALTAAFEGRLRKAAGGADAPLTSREVEEVFNAFIGGVDISRAIDKLGLIDLEKMTDETYNGIDELVADLQAGTLKLSEFARRDLATIIGVPINQVQATLAKVYGNVDGLGRVLDDEMLAAHLSKGVITSTDAVTATGNVAGDSAAAAAENAMDLAQLDEIAQQAADTAGPLPAAAVSPEATLALVEMRQRFAAEAEQAVAELARTYDLGDLKARAKVTTIIRDFMLPSIRVQVARLAAKRGMTVDKALDEVIRGDLRVITEDPEAFTVGGALKLDELGSHGRLDIASRLLTKNAWPIYRGTDAKAVANREALLSYAVESLMRSLGIPVRSTESAAAALRREGVKQGTKKAKSVKTQYSSVTFSDIARLAISKNNEDLIYQLRKFRGEVGKEYKFGNFVPNAIEAAWLTVKRYKESGTSFAKGDENYEEILFSLNNIEKLGGGFEPAYHAKLAKLGGAEAAAIEKTADDLIKFLSDNYDELKAIDAEREALIVGANTQTVYANTAQIFAGMIRFSNEFTQLKQAFAAGNLEDAELTFGIGQLLSEYDNLFTRLSTGAFSDKELAKNSAGMIKSMLLNAKIDGATKVKTLAQELTSIIAMTRATEAAYEGAKAAGKAEATAAKAGKAARTTQRGKSLSEELDITSEQLVRANEAGNATPAASETIDGATVETVSLNNAFAKQQTRWVKTAKAFSGNYGMGASFKTILSASEQNAVSWSHRFSLGLRAVFNATRGREDDVNAAFKALQDFRKESAAADELGETIDLAGFLAARNVDREIYDLLDESFNVLLGNKNIFGAARSFGLMKDELNVALRQFGLKGIQVGDSRTLDDFWLDYKPEMFPERSPLEFINLLSLAVHRAAARVEIASQFSQFVAKTRKEIAEAGENIKDYVEIEANTGIGQLLGETNKLVHRNDAERLKYVQDYLNYDSLLSEGAVAKLVEISDRVTYVLKSTNTLLRPGHHVTSIVGEAAMNALAGVRTSSYNNTARILNKFRPGQYENAGEPFKAYAELNATKGKRIKATEFDTVAWITPSGKREVLPDEIVYNLAERFGVLVHPGGSLEDFITAGDVSFKGAYAKFHGAMNKISVFASHRDNFFRLTHFIDELQKTTGAKTLEEAALAAATIIREWHPTAGSLSAFEKKYARRVVYFYTWQRVALTKVIETMISRPGIATIPSKVQYAFADANGFNPESFGDPWDPDGIYASWHTGQMWGPQFQGPAGEGDSWGVQPAIQPIDVIGQIVKPFTLQPGDDPLGSMSQGAQDLLGNNLNPIIKTLIESSSQSRLGEGGDLPGPAEYLLGQIGVISTLSKVTGIGQDPNPYETPEERAENNSRLIANVLLGQRITDYSTPATQYKWTLDQQEIMRRMAE
jgi:hypothetical protein